MINELKQIQNMLQAILNSEHDDPLEVSKNGIIRRFEDSQNDGQHKNAIEIPKAQTTEYFIELNGGFAKIQLSSYSSNVKEKTSNFTDKLKKLNQAYFDNLKSGRY